MAKINIYLNFKGKTEEAFNLYKSVFGREFAILQRYKDTPQAGKVAENEQNMIMHVSLPINNIILMGTDELESRGQALTMGTNFNISISAESKEEADKLFQGLSEGGKVEMAMEDSFWNSYFGMLTDKFGIKWMIDFAYEKK